MKTLLSLALSTALIAATGATALAAPDQTARRGDRISMHDRFEHRAPLAWDALGTRNLTGNRATFAVPRGAGRIDDLKLDVSRGVLDVRRVVVTFVDGSTYVATVGKRLTPGASHVVTIPGVARRIASVEVRGVASKVARRGSGWIGRGDAVVTLSARAAERPRTARF
jgi:hypothetical protein